jgi:hypothetical protein
LLEGKKGDCEKADPRYSGWSGKAAHPKSPRGSGGPGRFARSGKLNANASNLPHQRKPKHLGIVPMQLSLAAKPPKSPPATNPRSLGSKKSVQNNLVDVSIDAEIVADGKVNKVDFLITSFKIPRFNAPGYSTGGTGKITRFNGKFEWKGTIIIQTVYGSGIKATDVSCYGRGTTNSDVQNRDITLGFHENCHQVDFENYLKNNVLPDPPDFNIGMSTADYDTELKRFKKEYKAYDKAMNQDTETNTDEVGLKKSTNKKTRKCFVHVVP